jgi:two-component system sensor histidine kinase VicK
MQAALRDESSLPPFEYSLVRKDGEEIPVEITISVICNAQGQQMFIQSVVRDITERKRAEQQRLELETERARVEAMKQFVGETSHDLRTPISVITTSLYLLRKKLPPEQANLRQLDALEAQTQHMIHILENLGRLADLDANAVTFNFGNVNLNTLVDRLVEQFQPVAQEHNLLLKAELAPAKVIVRADDVQLTRAVQNLINNALNYTSAGSVSVIVRCENCHAVLEVRDTGMGIPSESLPYIFDRFYRADVARPAYQGGMGLGLTITRRIVEMHGGVIEVESKVGQGSCFRISLPCSETREPNLEKQSA